MLVKARLVVPVEQGVYRIDFSKGTKRMNVITVVKFKVKEGFEGKFLDAINNYDYSKSVLWRIIGLDNNEYVTITEYNSIDDTGDDEVSGLDWLDSIAHMLDYYGENRTQSYSGIVLSGSNN